MFATISMFIQVSYLILINVFYYKKSHKSQIFIIKCIICYLLFYMQILSYAIFEKLLTFVLFLFNEQ